MKLSWIAVACAIAYSSVAAAQPNTQDAATLSPPRLVQSAEPIYPEAKRAGGEAASVVLTLTIDHTGHVSDVVVAESAGTDFDEAASNAARQLLFEPAQRNGEAVLAKIRYRFDFKLEAPPPPAEPPPAPTSPPVAVVAPAPKVVVAPSEDDTLDLEVQGEKPPREPTKRVLAAEEITKIPGTNGDALRSIGNMPGVARPPLGSGALIVRGSSPNDTQIFVDGANIPIVYHFGGLSSVIPSEMLEKIDFYPGNFGPQYGRANGGIVDVGVRSPRKDRLGGLLQFDLIDGRLLAEGPISKSTRVMVAGRRSWLDAWLGPVLRSSGVGVSLAPVYYDYQAMIEHDLSRDTTVRVFAFGSSDRFKLTLSSPNSSDPAIGGAASESTHFWRVQTRLDSHPTSTIHSSSQVSFGQDGAAFSAEGALCDGACEVRVGGADQAHVALAGGVAAEALKFAGLKHT